MINKILRIINILEVIVIILLLSFSTTKIVEWNKESKETKELINDIKNYTEDNKITNLKVENNDTIGILKVNNTNIDYPFVQAKDNNYYLTHNFNKKKTSAGWIFLDKRNNKDLNDKNNIIYGHSRKDKSMFGTLKNTLSKEWYMNKNNRNIKILTETRTYNYEIFSIYKIEKENYYLQTEFKTDKEYKVFLNIIKDRSIYNFDINIENITSILTLSTCYKNDRRVVVHAKLID